MTSNDYFERGQVVKEKRAKICLIRNSPKAFLNDYFKSIINDVDIYAETTLSKKSPSQVDQINTINRIRQTILDRIASLESSTELNMSLLSDCFKHTDNSGLLTSEILHLKRKLFNNKWIFFRANKRVKDDEVDFGRLIIVDEIFIDELMFDFNKIGDFDNPANLKRFILSKGSNKLCNDYMKLYAICKQISNHFKDVERTIIEISQDDIFKIDEMKFERYDFHSIENIAHENQFVNLKTLYINHNKIQQLNRQSFLNLVNLQHLNLSFNKLGTVESNWFESLANLRELDLSNNHINLVENDAFAGLKSLKDLDLSGNRLTELNHNTLTRLPSLTEVDLSCNNFKILPNFMFDGIVSLEKIYINSNEIEIVEERAFNNLANLKELQLNMNKIGRIEVMTFNNQLDTLSKIDLRFNEIKTIEPEVFNNLRSLKVVLLYGNLDLIHEIDQRDFYVINENNERVNYLTFDGNYYETDEEDDDEESDEEMDYNSDASESDEEKDNYDSDY